MKKLKWDHCLQRIRFHSCSRKAGRGLASGENHKKDNGYICVDPNGKFNGLTPDKKNGKMNGHPLVETVTESQLQIEGSKKYVLNVLN